MTKWTAVATNDGTAWVYNTGTATTTWTTTDSGWYAPSTMIYRDWDWRYAQLQNIGFPYKEGVVVKQAKSYLVIQRGANSIAAVEETEGDALSAAARLATKTGEEYFVFRPGKVVRQKPVDIETIDP